jgi:hypothetical protein
VLNTLKHNRKSVDDKCSSAELVAFKLPRMSFHSIPLSEKQPDHRPPAKIAGDLWAKIFVLVRTY